jgi:hypothetical protein
MVNRRWIWLAALALTVGGFAWRGLLAQPPAKSAPAPKGAAPATKAPVAPPAKAPAAKSPASKAPEAKAPAQESPKQPAPQADPSAPPTAESLVKGQQLLAAAQQKLAGYPWVQAGVRQRVELFGKRLEGSGSYLRGPNFKMKLELRIAVDDRRPPSSLQQVCDGHWLYDHRDVLGQRQLSKVDVAAVRDALARKGASLPAHLAGERSLTLLGLGGLDQLLRGLSDQFDFADAGEMPLGKDRYQALRGTWKREVLVRMLPDQKAKIEKGEPPDLKKLPEHVPDEVYLLLGAEDLFPYRLEYRRTAIEQPEGSAKGQTPAIAVGKSLVIMELYDVAVNRPVDDLHFLFQPDIQAIDRTDEFLKQMKLKD